MTILIFKVIIDILHILSINQKRKEYLHILFNKYVWEKVLEKKDKSKYWKLAENKKIAIMFSDIAWFTNISEKLSAQEVIQMLNIYFKHTNKEIWYSKWFIDKYIWDVWDKNEKISYTAIWDNINLWARLEWINKFYWTNIIISEDFYIKLKDKSSFIIRLIDKITVKWKTESIKIYHVFAKTHNEVSPELINYIKLFKKGLNLYFDWNFKKAKIELEMLEIFKIWQNDPTLKILLERINYLIQNKPKTWDWVWRFNKK